MRTMLNVVAVFVFGGVLLFPSRSAQACHGRKACSICAAKKACNSGYGYGYYYGYTYPPAYGYSYNNPPAQPARCSVAEKDKPTKPKDADVTESMTTTLAQLNATLKETNTSLKEVQSRLDRVEARLTDLEKKPPSPGR